VIFALFNSMKNLFTTAILKSDDPQYKK